MSECTNKAVIVCSSVAIFCLLMTMWIPVYLCEQDCWPEILIASIPVIGILTIVIVWVCVEGIDRLRTDPDTEIV